MLLTKEVYIRINNKNYQHYIDKGYELEYIYNKYKKCMGYKRDQEILVKIEDLSKGSHAEIEILCDYCLERGIETIVSKEYRTYLIQNNKSLIKKDCCKECWSLKLNESIKLVHNVDNISQLENIKNKKQNKSINHFGTECVLQSEEVKDKIRITNIEKYGSPNVMGNKDIQNKVFKSRAITLYKNKTGISSIPQRYLHNLFGGELNYPINTANLDIGFPDDKIYIEYDGSGHKMSITLGNMTEKEFLNKERKRFFGLRNKGWKVIRIISELLRDKLPSDEVLIKMYEYAIQYFNTGHTYIKFDIDNAKIITSQFEKEYNYGVLRNITKNMLTN